MLREFLDFQNFINRLVFFLVIINADFLLKGMGVSFYFMMLEDLGKGRMGISPMIAKQIKE